MTKKIQMDSTDNFYEKIKEECKSIFKKKSLINVRGGGF